MAGITSTKKIKGQPHLLAYITPNEVEKLKALGGQETMTPEGIPAYPEYDNYGYSSQADFDAGDTSKSNDPNVNRESTFETYRDGKNIGVDNTLKQKSLARRAQEAKDVKEKTRLEKEAKEIQKALDRGQTYGYGKNQTGFQKAKTYFSNKQRKANLDLAKKRSFQKYKTLEKYIHGDMDMEYDFTVDIYGNKVPKGLENLISNKGTSIATKRPNLYDVNSKLPGLLGFGVNKIRPDTQVTLQNTLNKARSYNDIVLNSPNLTNQQISDEMNRLKNLGRTQDQIELMEGGGGGGSGSGGQQYIPYLPPEETEEVIDDKIFPYHLGLGGQKVGRDVTLGYAANGGRITRAGGGIMNAVPRQGYFLGGIGKAIKGVVGGVADAAGKVLKSDAGKMALLAGGAYMLGGAKFMGGEGMFTSGQGLSRFGNIGRKLLLKDGMNFGDKGALSLGKILGLSAALPFIPGLNKVPENEDIGMADRGGRLIDPITGEEATPAEMRANIENAKIEAGGDPVKLAALNQKYNNMLFSILPYKNYGTYAQGGRIRAQEGGLMNLGGMEKDYRNEGGFVPIGKQEKADDVPARLSVNEFVFTADAVRNAGGGDIDKGAEVMENMMKNLENGGRVSEESQGNTGAQEMFSVSERIGEVI